MKRFLMLHVAILSALLLVTPGRAQDADPDLTPPNPAVPQGENMEVPEGWLWRLDHPDPEVEVSSDTLHGHDDVFFVNMTPGWHISTGPAMILYHPALTAEAPYRAEATFHLFPPGDRNEAFGLFVGGRDLDADDQSYLYFLIRRSGDVLVKRRHGSSTSLVHDWSESPAVVPYTEATTGSVENVLAVEAGQDSLRFLVNDRQVATIARGDLPVDGIVGLRVNHRLNLHVSDLAVEPLE